MIRLIYLYLISISGFLFLLLSCTEEMKISKNSYNNDALFNNRETYVVSNNGKANQKYYFSVGNFDVQLNKLDLFKIKSYSIWDDEKERVDLSFQRTDKLYSYFKNKGNLIENHYIGGVEFGVVNLDKDKYKKIFKKSGLGSLELMFNNEEKDGFSSIKIDFDLLNENETNLKFEENIVDVAQVKDEVIEEKNIRWFYKQDLLNNETVHTIYLQTQIKNIEIIEKDEEDILSDKTDDNRVVSIVVSGSFKGSFNEENKNDLVKKMIEILNNKTIN